MSITYSANPWSSNHGYTPSNNKDKLPYLKTMSEQDVRALENTPDYQAYTDFGLTELANRNSEYTKQYINALVNNLKKTSPQSFQMINGKETYLGDENSVLQQDENGYFINVDAWKTARTDGKKGFIHDFKLSTTESPQTVVPVEESNIKVNGTTYANPFKTDNTPLTFNKPKHIPWTDWIPHTMQLMNAHVANSKLAKLQKQMSFPKRIAPQKNAIVTDAYAQRQLLEKQKQELLAKADATQVSNIDQKMAIMRQAEEQAGKYNDAQVQLQSQEYAQTKKDVNDVANWNLVQRAEVANHNAKVNSAAYNNWLNAEKQKVASDSAARKSYLYDMYKDYGLYKQDQRLNERAYKEAQLKLDLTNKLSELENIFQDKSDPSRWEMLSQYAVEFVNDGQLTDESEKAIVGSEALSKEAVTQKLQQDPQFRNLILTKLLTGTDDVTKRFKAAFDEYIKRLNRDYDAAYNSHYMQNQAAKAALPVTVSNQIFKKGGKLKVLQEVVKQNQKEKESNRKASSDFHKRTSKELARQLGALDKEQLMLLKSIFS